MAFLELHRVIDAPRALLWYFISTPEGLSTWHADQVTGSLEQKRFQVAWPTLNAHMSLQVESVEPKEKIVLRAGTSLVELSIEAGGVRLTHAGLDEEDDLPGFRSSWSLALSLLEHAALRHPKSTRRVEWLFERAETTPELVHYYFTSAIGLSQWLGQTARDLGDVKSPVELALTRDLRLTGEVLSHEPERDLALTWKELDDAVLVLRTLPAPEGQRSLALSLSTYTGQSTEEARSFLQISLTRLAEALRGRGRG